MFTENAGGVNVGDFKTFWNLALSIQVGYYSGSGIGLSSNGDGVLVYTSAGTEVNRVSFGSAVATPNKTFYWSSEVSGALGTPTGGVVRVSGTNGAYTTSYGWANANVGSPGSAVTVATVPNLYWTSDGANRVPTATSGVEGYVRQFTAVPEPATPLLTACGAAMVAWHLRRRRFFG